MPSLAHLYLPIPLMSSLHRPFTRRAAAVCLAVALASPAGAQYRAPAATAAGTAASSASLAARARLADSARREIDAAAAAGDRERIAAARGLVDAALVAHPDDALLLHYRGYALWREASILYGTGDAAAARPLLEQADRALERSAKRLPLPETFAIRASVTGQMIGASRNPLAAMRLGPRSGSLMAQAEKAGPHNPRVWLVKGMNALHAPAMFGGGADRAQAHLQRALELFAADAPTSPLPAWGRAEAHAYLGQAHAKQGRDAEAQAAYERALALEPGNAWVRK